MKRIPFNRPVFDAAEMENLRRVVDSGFVAQGPMTAEFEKKFAGAVGLKHGIATNSGTTALQVALNALGVSAGDEVITTALSFVASGNCIMQAGAKPVFVDVERDTLNIDPKKIADKITERTRAIVPVHLLGIPADMDPIMETARKRNIPVLEDCALAHGAKYRGKNVGTFGDIAAFSFYGSKIITSGEGGMLLTNDDGLAKKMRLLRSHGNNPEKKFDHLLFGYSYQLSDLNAAVGLAQVDKLAGLVEKRRRNAARLDSCLKDVQGIITLPEKQGNQNSYFGYPIVVTSAGKSAENIREELGKRGIETRPIYYVIPHLSFYGEKESYPVAEEIARNGFFVSCSPVLSEEDMDYTGQCIRKAVQDA